MQVGKAIQKRVRAECTGGHSSPDPKRSFWSFDRSDSTPKLETNQPGSKGRAYPPHTRVYNPQTMTEQIKRKLQEEMNALEHELVHDLPQEIKKAAALGDLSENAEYHMAKQRQEFVKARLRQLGARMAELALINMDNIPKDKVGLGSTVRVYDDSKNSEVEYRLVTSEESDVAAGKISTSSPIGRALLNKKVGDTATVVTPNGKREMEVLSLITIHEQPEAK
jgi:transcription elongation factor GreA